MKSATATRRAGSLPTRRGKHPRYRFYPGEPEIVRALRIPRCILQRLGDSLRVNHGSQGATGELLVRLLDWLSIQEPRVLTAMIVRCQKPAPPGVSPLEWFLSREKDAGPGEGIAFDVNPGLRLRFGDKLFKVTPGGVAPPPTRRPPRFTVEEQAFLQDFGAEVDATYTHPLEGEAPADAAPTET